MPGVLESGRLRLYPLKILTLSEPDLGNASVGKQQIRFLIWHARSRGRGLF